MVCIIWGKLIFTMLRLDTPHFCSTWFIWLGSQNSSNIVSSLNLLSSLSTIITVLKHTVSLVKGSGSKGKKHYKSTASEMQTQKQWSNKIKAKLWNVLKVAETRHKYQPDHHCTDPCLHGNEVISVTPEAVELYLKIWHYNLFSLLASVWMSGSA